MKAFIKSAELDGPPDTDLCLRLDLVSTGPVGVREIDVVRRALMERKALEIDLWRVVEDWLREPMLGVQEDKGMQVGDQVVVQGKFGQVVGISGTGLAVKVRPEPVDGVASDLVVVDRDQCRVVRTYQVDVLLGLLSEAQSVIALADGRIEDEEWKLASRRFRLAVEAAGSLMP